MSFRGKRGLIWLKWASFIAKLIGPQVLLVLEGRNLGPNKKLLE